MRIGIDIDGVLTNIESCILDEGTKFCIENKIPFDINTIDYDEQRVFGWTNEQTLEFWNKYLVEYATKYPARKYASDIIHKLKSEGHEIYIITARNEWGLPDEAYGKMKEFVNEWLKENAIYYDKIIYTEGSKVPYCVGNYIELMLEDSPKNVIEISEKIPVLCYNNSYNNNIEGNNIVRVYSWYDIYNKIKKMCK